MSETSNPSSLICVCGHGRNSHKHWGFDNTWTLCHITSCPCYNYMSTLDVEKKRVADDQEVKQLKDLDENYTQFVKRNHCPKCGKGSHPTIEFHPNSPWYKFNRCKLGIKSEHIHLICDLCKAHYSVKCLDKVLDKLGVKLYGDNQ